MASQAFDQAFEQAKMHIQAGRADEAFASLSQFEPQARTDLGCALGFLALYRLSPGRTGLVEGVMNIANGFPLEPAVVMRACDALIREAERQAPDEPPSKDGAAHMAVQLSQRCLEGMPETDREDLQTFAYLQVCYGNALRLAHLHDRAVSALTSALKKMPDQGAWWFNLGLLHKQRRDFAAGVQANVRARELMGDQKAVLWNLAICATAAGRGELAVEAFGTLGLSAYLSDTGMPLIDHMPPVQVRIATVGPGHMGPSQVPDSAVSFELVWVSPLSPCHGVIQTPTYRQGSADFGDVVLWDAVPVGIAEHEGKKTPCFPLLSILAKGAEHRFRFVALERSPGAIAALEGELDNGGQVFVHRERVVEPKGGTTVHDGGSEARTPLVYGKVVLPAGLDLSRFRADFDARTVAAGVELVMPELLEAIGDTAAAGKAHTMWRGIERTVEKGHTH